jgi:hypothetical protein
MRLCVVNDIVRILDAFALLCIEICMLPHVYLIQALCYYHDEHQNSTIELTRLSCLLSGVLS